MGIPRHSRVAANAILLWNGDWAGEADVGGPAQLTILKASIRQIVAAAAPDCRNQALVGPRFMLIPDVDGMLVLAVGSGSWSWNQLLDDQDRPFSL